MKKWIKGSLAILLGVMSISIPFAGIHTAEAKTTEETDKKAEHCNNHFSRSMTGQESFWVTGQMM